MLVAANSLIAAIILIVAAVLLTAAVVGRKDRSSETSSRIRPTIGQPMAETYMWEVDRFPNLDSIVQALNERGFGLRPRQKSHDSIVLSGGSQIRTRLLGGYFVDPKWLPSVVELKTAKGSVGAGCRVELDIRDDFGIAVRDDALRGKFEQVAGNLGKAVEAHLESMNGVRVDSVPQSPED